MERALDYRQCVRRLDCVARGCCTERGHLVVPVTGSRSEHLRLCAARQLGGLRAQIATLKLEVPNWHFKLFRLEFLSRMCGAPFNL
jgi:hypothetical protein